MVVSVGKVALPPDGTSYLRHLLDDPKNRAVVARILNDESRALKAICEEVAEEDLHHRPPERRTRESLAHGPEYHASFQIIEAKQLGPNKMKTGVENTHPFARAVENGTPAHTIRSSGRISFPWNLRRQGPHDGPGLGDFLVDGDSNFSGHVVNHTGAGAKKVMARARRRYLDRARRAARR